MQFHILTLYPDMFPATLAHSLSGAALREGKWSINAVNMRDFATDKHRTVDDTPYGGGAGMVLKPDVVAAAIEDAKAQMPDAPLIYFTPRGAPLTQTTVQHLASHPAQHYILLCGRFEGIDERVIAHYQPIEISLGDYILCGGELPALVLMEAMLRYLPSLLGNAQTLHEESFSYGAENAGLLEYPHYTKPPYWNGYPVPETLLSGNHAAIRAWRLAQAQRITQEKRPELWERYLSEKQSLKT